jgi:NAD(P)-dependent dehydrogenase (short-subunit alcohol dehydrogenase family)
LCVLVPSKERWVSQNMQHTRCVRLSRLDDDPKADGSLQASKHGLLGLVRSAAKEVGERNIRVNAVTPGSIETPLMDKRNALEGVVPGDYHPTPINRLGTSKEVGNLIAFLLSDESSFISGATYAVDGAWAC